MKNNYEIIDDVVKIELNRNGKESLYTYIDLEDLPRLKTLNVMWCAGYDVSTRTYYAKVTIYNGVVSEEYPVRSITLQTFIMNPNREPNIKIDHIDHDTLNNRRYNLRKITQQENLRYRKGRNKNNVTGYRNVAYIKSHKTRPYHVQLMVNGKNTVLGRFADVDEAGEFARDMRKKYYGKFAGKS